MLAASIWRCFLHHIDHTGGFEKRTIGKTLDARANSQPKRPAILFNPAGRSHEFSQSFA